MQEGRGFLRFTDPRKDWEKHSVQNLWGQDVWLWNLAIDDIQLVISGGCRINCVMIQTA